MWLMSFHSTEQLNALQERSSEGDDDRMLEEHIAIVKIEIGKVLFSRFSIRSDVSFSAS
jgi:hypothetical protein